MAREEKKIEQMIFSQQEIDLKNYITNVENFPQPGIVFRDITPLLSDNSAFNQALDGLSVKLDMFDDIDLIAGIESRGFIFGSALAGLNSLGFIPVRKTGKLPPPVVSESSTKEYGEDVLEVKENPSGKKHILIVDDVLATGGTLLATERLLTKAGYNVVGALVLIDIGIAPKTFTIGGNSVVSLIRY